MILRKSLTEQAAVLFAGNALALLVGAVVPMVLVRVFTLLEYGLYQQLFLIFTTLLPLGQMGVTQGLYYFLPREPEKRDAVVAQTLLFVLAAGAICFLVLMVFRFRIAELMNNPEIGQHLPVLALFILFMIVSSFLEALMIAEGKTGFSSLVRVVSELIRSLTVIFTALVTHNVLAVLIALACFSLARCVFLWVYLTGRYRLFSGGIDFAFWWRQLSYSLPIGFANVAWLFQIRLHSFFVTFLFTPATYAIYAIGTYSLPFLGLISSAASNVMVPELARCQKDGNRARILSAWSGALRKMNLFYFPLFVFFFIVAHEFIVVLFTEQYAESVSIFRISLLGLLVSGLNTGAILGAYAETRYLMGIALLRLAVAIPVLYLFTMTWGIHGAVTADVLVSAFFRLFVLGKVARVMETSFAALCRPGENGRIMAAALLAGLPVLALKHFLVVTPLFMLACAALVFILAYSIVGFGLRIVTQSDIDLLRRIIVARFPVSRRPS